MKSVLLRRLRSSGAYGVVESDAISDALATRAGIALKPWKYATTLFTDTAGTVAASAAGDIIAVAKDDSRGLTPGPELVTNGTFDSGAGWNLSNATISGGTANINDTAFQRSVFQNLASGSYMAGRLYEVSFTVSARSAGTIIAYLAPSGSAKVAQSASVSANGTYTFILAPTSTVTQFGFESQTGSVVLSIDNVSVKELPYNQYQQNTLANRPILTRWPKAGKRNLLTWTEDFSNAAWTKPSATITANTDVAPDGTTTADKLTATSSSYPSAYCTVATTAAVAYAISIYAKSSTASTLSIEFRGSGGSPDAVFNLANGTLTSGSGTITSAGNGWYRCSITKNSVDTSELAIFGMGALPSISDAILIWGAQVELGSSATAYQKVTIAQDVTEAGQSDCWGLTFDGTNDSMATAATLNLSGSDKVGVFAGVTKLSDAAIGIVCEHGTTETIAGSFTLQAPYVAAGSNYLVGSCTTTGRAQYSLTTYAAPISNVVSVAFDQAQATQALGIVPRVNGAAPTTVSSVRALWGTGNVGNLTNYIGARAGTSFYFNGIIWGAAIVSTLTTADATIIADIEAQIAANTPTVSL